MQNHFSKTSLSLLADSTMISVDSSSTSYSPPSQHHYLTSDLKWALVIVLILLVVITMQITSSCNIPEKKQEIIYSNSQFKSSLKISNKNNFEVRYYILFKSDNKIKISNIKFKVFVNELYLAFEARVVIKQNLDNESEGAVMGVTGT